MSPDSKESVCKLAERVYRDPRRATWADVDMLARAVLKLAGRQLPERRRA